MRAPVPKGNQVDIPELGPGKLNYGNISFTGEAYHPPKKGFRPFLTPGGPCKMLQAEIGLARMEWHLNFWGVWYGVRGP